TASSTQATKVAAPVTWRSSAKTILFILRTPATTRPPKRAAAAGRREDHRAAGPTREPEAECHPARPPRGSRELGTARRFLDSRLLDGLDGADVVRAEFLRVPGVGRGDRLAEGVAVDLLHHFHAFLAQQR